MTEKRFTMDNGSNEDVCLVDNLTKKEYESNFRDIVDLMNELNDENEQLKEENKQLQSKLEQYERIMSDFDVSSFGELRTIMEQGCGV